MLTQVEEYGPERRIHKSTGISVGLPTARSTGPLLEKVTKSNTITAKCCAAQRDFQALGEGCEKLVLRFLLTLKAQQGDRSLVGPTPAHLFSCSLSIPFPLLLQIEFLSRESCV